MTKEVFIQWRKAKNLTQTEAASLLGIQHRTTVARYESGAIRIPGPVACLVKAFKDPIIWKRMRRFICTPTRQASKE